MIGVAYISLNAQFAFDSLNSIFDSSPIIIDGDFNTKHRDWNNFYNNIILGESSCLTI